MWWLERERVVPTFNRRGYVLLGPVNDRRDHIFAVDYGIYMHKLAQEIGTGNVQASTTRTFFLCFFLPGRRILTFSLSLSLALHLSISTHVLNTHALNTHTHTHALSTHTRARAQNTHALNTHTCTPSTHTCTLAEPLPAGAAPCLWDLFRRGGWRAAYAYAMGQAFVPWFKVTGPFATSRALETGRTELYQTVRDRGFLANGVFVLMTVWFACVHASVWAGERVFRVLLGEGEGSVGGRLLAWSPLTLKRMSQWY